MTERRKPERDELSALAALGPFLGHGLTFAMAATFFFFVGWRLDRWLGTTPVLSIVGAFVGAGGGSYYIVRKLAPTPESPNEGDGNADPEQDL